MIYNFRGVPHFHIYPAFPSRSGNGSLCPENGLLAICPRFRILWYPRHLSEMQLVGSSTIS